MGWQPSLKGAHTAETASSRWAAPLLWPRDKIFLPLIDAQERSNGYGRRIDFYEKRSNKRERPATLWPRRPGGASRFNTQFNACKEERSLRWTRGCSVRRSLLSASSSHNRPSTNANTMGSTVLRVIELRIDIAFTKGVVVQPAAPPSVHSSSSWNPPGSETP